MSRVVLAASITGLAALTACSEPSTPSVNLPKEEPEEFTREQMNALGYVSFPDEERPETEEGQEETGLVVFDRERMSPGFVLIYGITENEARLLNRRGVTKRHWVGNHGDTWTRAELQANGDLIVMGRSEGWGFVSRYDWEGNGLWRKKLMSHHDLDTSESGDVLVLESRDRNVNDVIIDDCLLTRFEGDGTRRESHSVYKLLTSRPDRFVLPLESLHPLSTTNSNTLDLLHVNSVAWMPFPELVERGDPYRKSAVLLSVRHQNLIAIADIETTELLWAWGPELIEFPHEATWLANGNVLLFDNGTPVRGFSRIVEVDPRTDEIVWEYRSDPPDRFFSAGRGTAQQLPDGNVLVASSNQGEVFEVTREGDVVWRYVLRNRSGRRLVVRASHYPRELVEPLLPDKATDDGR